MKQNTLDQFDQALSQLAKASLQLPPGACKKYLDNLMYYHTGMLTHDGTGIEKNEAPIILSAFVQMIQKNPLVRASVSLAHPNEMELLKNIADPMVWLNFGLASFNDVLGKVESLEESAQQSFGEPLLQEARLRQASYLIGVLFSSLKPKNERLFVKQGAFSALVQKHTTDPSMVYKEGLLEKVSQQQSGVALAVGSAGVAGVLAQTSWIAGNALVPFLGLMVTHLMGVLLCAKGRSPSVYLPWGKSVLKKMHAVYPSTKALSVQEQQRLLGGVSGVQKLKPSEIFWVLAHAPKSTLLEVLEIPPERSDVVHVVQQYLHHPKSTSLIGMSGVYLDETIRSAPKLLRELDAVGQKSANALALLFEEKLQWIVGDALRQELSSLSEQKELQALLPTQQLKKGSPRL